MTRFICREKMSKRYLLYCQLCARVCKGNYVKQNSHKRKVHAGESWISSTTVSDSFFATSISISRRLSKSNALSSLLSRSAASASSHFSRKSSRRFPWSVFRAAPGALGAVVRSEESPDGGGTVKSIARKSRVSANVSKLQAIVSRQYSLILMTPYLRT